MEIDVLSNEQLGFLSLVRIVAILLARSGETTTEITESELMLLPTVPLLETSKSPAAFAHRISVDLPPETVHKIREYAQRYADDRVGIVDAEVVEDQAAAFGLMIAGRTDVTPVVGRERVINLDEEEG